MTAKRKVPKLRFPEFGGEWEEKRLGQLCSTFKSGTGITSDDIYETGEYPVYGGNGLRGYTNSFTHEGFFVLIGRQGALCGNINRVSGKSYISEHAIAVASNETSDTEWLAQKLDYSKLNRLSESSAQPGLAVNKLVNIKLSVPTLPEQQKIATFLSTIDTRIQQLSRKKALLEQYKKGVMQQIFSQEIRFKDEEGKEFPAWEERKAKTIFRNHTNKDHNGDLPILAITQDKGVVPRDSIDKEIQSSESSVLSYKIVMPGDFVISLRSFQGGIEYSEIKGICSPAYTVLKASTEICDAFFKQYLKKESFIRQLNNTVVGIREGKQISFDAFSGLILPFPCIPEQQKIAAFLSSLDRQINQAAQRLERMQTFKKGLLQQMFV